MRLRSSAASRSTSRPATRALPPSGRSSVVRMRTAVVLPAPLGPSRPSTVPVGARRSIPSRAHTSPKDLRSPLVSIAQSAAIDATYAKRLRTAQSSKSKSLGGFCSNQSWSSSGSPRGSPGSPRARPRCGAASSGVGLLDRLGLLLDQALLLGLARRRARRAHSVGSSTARLAARLGVGASSAWSSSSERRCSFQKASSSSS